jgi:hypothetical protein
MRVVFCSLMGPSLQRIVVVTAKTETRRRTHRAQRQHRLGGHEADVRLSDGAQARESADTAAAGTEGDESVDDRYLERGLLGMARAGEPFMAHFGAALLAAWWLDHDHALAPAVAVAMSEQADRMIAKHGWLFSEAPVGPPATEPAAKLISALSPYLEQTWAIGHDVIYVSLALRTLAARPELCDDTALDGLCRLLDACHEQPLLDVAQRFDVRDVAVDSTVDVGSPQALARVVLETAVGFRHVYAGLHQGEIGHILDHGHAVLVLERLGARAEAERARLGLLHHVAALRHVWEATLDLPEVPRARGDHPGTLAYWNRELGPSDWAVGHVFKYPYALFDLVALVDDEALTTAATDRVLQLV